MCIVKGDAQKSPLFWRFSGGFWFSQDRLFSGNSTRKPLNLIRSPIFTNTPCKTACRYNAPSMRTLDQKLLGSRKWNWIGMPRRFWAGILGVTFLWGPEALEKTRPKNSQKRFAIKIRWEIRRQVSSNLPGQTKNHPKSALQNLGLNKLPQKNLCTVTVLLPMLCKEAPSKKTSPFPTFLGLQLILLQRLPYTIRTSTIGAINISQKAADVWKKDVWDFQAFSQTSLELRFSLGNEGKDGKNLNSQTWPGTPRRPSPRHPRPPELLLKCFRF